MTLAVMQPYFFPYLGYYQLVAATDMFVFYDDVNFIKRGWVNRNRILVNGKDNLITVPLISPSQNVLIKDTLVFEDKWREKLLRTLEHAYGKAPHFGEVMPLVSGVIQSPARTIADLAIASVESVCGYLGIGTQFRKSSEAYHNMHLKGQMRILDICKSENAGRYINPIGGREIYSRELFDARQIDLWFLKPESPAYRQFDNDFVPNLSMIDVLMFNDRPALQEMLKQYELVR